MSIKYLQQTSHALKFDVGLQDCSHVADHTQSSTNLLVIAFTEQIWSCHVWSR